MPNSNPTPVKEVLADYQHPAHDAVIDTLAKLKTGEISLCACLGAMYGEPYCPCEMSRRGLPPSPQREAAQQDAQERLTKLFEAGRLSLIRSAPG